MDKILKLLVDDFQNEKPSAEYLLALDKFCKAENAFMSLLDKKTKGRISKTRLYLRRIGYC